MFKYLPGAEINFVAHEPGLVATDRAELTIGASHSFDATPDPRPAGHATRDLPLLKTPEGAILASNEPEFGECRLNPQGRARPGARQPTTPITDRILS